MQPIVNAVIVYGIATVIAMSVAVLISALFRILRALRAGKE